MQKLLSNKFKHLLIVGAILLNLLSLSQAQAQEATSPSGTLAATREGVQQMGKVWNAEVFDKTVALYSLLHKQTPWPEMPQAELIQYGADPEQNLMLFLPEQPFSEPGPVGLFVHGNGLSHSDQIIPHSDDMFYAHFGKLMTTYGGIGITMNYRTGPQSSAMTGAEDLGLAIHWIKSNIESYGGAIDTVVLLAASEGATLATTYLFDQDLQTDATPGIAMAVLSSGEFGESAPDLPALIEQYEGEQIPLLLWSAELDSIAMDTNTIKLYGILCKKNQQCPAYEKLPGHNRLSAILSLGTEDTTVFNSLMRFYHTLR